MRMEEEIPTKYVLRTKPGGNRERGRSKLPWIKKMEND